MKISKCVAQLGKKRVQQNGVFNENIALDCYIEDVCKACDGAYSQVTTYSIFKFSKADRLAAELKTHYACYCVVLRASHSTRLTRSIQIFRATYLPPPPNPAHLHSDILIPN